MKIAILYICTGKYSQFFQKFHQSAKEHFLTGIADIEYFVFTDMPDLSNSDDVHIIPKECLGFPMDAVFRFHTLLTVEDMVKDFDYVYFFNSNALFIQDVGKEILPPDSESFIGSRWPRRKPFNLPMFFPYERNKQSTAYIPPRESQKYIYYMSGFYGASPQAFFKKYHILDANTQTDYQKGIIAIFHDESHTNKYFRQVHCKLLPDGYCLPEEWATDKTDTHILFRNKVAIDPYFNKGIKNSFGERFKKGFRIVHRAISWYL